LIILEHIFIGISFIESLLIRFIGLGEPDLNNIPGWAERFLGKPKSRKFEDEGACGVWLNLFKIDKLLISGKNLTVRNTLC
jgi:hypothetical protein